MCFSSVTTIEHYRGDHVMGPPREGYSNCSWKYLYRSLALVFVVLVLYAIYGGKKRIFVGVEDVLNYPDRPPLSGNVSTQGTYGGGY